MIFKLNNINVDDWSDWQDEDKKTPNRFFAKYLFKYNNETRTNSFFGKVSVVLNYQFNPNVILPTWYVKFAGDSSFDNLNNDFNKSTISNYSKDQFKEVQDVVDAFLISKRVLKTLKN